MPKTLDFMRISWYNISMMNDTLTATKFQKIIEQQNEKIAKLEALIQYYEAQLLLAKRRQFGASSERTEFDFRQLNLFGEAEIAPPPEPETEEITYKRKKKKGKREED